MDDIQRILNRRADSIKHLPDYELTCHLKEGGLVKYGTYFKSDGKAELRYTQKKEHKNNLDACLIQ